MSSYFTVAELRALPDMSDDERFSNPRLVAAHDWIAGIIRRECTTSFVVESVTETISGRGVCALRPSDPYIREVTAVAVDGVAWESAAVATLVVDDGLVYQYGDAAWSGAARRNVSLTYNAGYSVAPPLDLKEAALRAARHWLLTMDAWSGVDERSTAITNDFGTISLATPGEERPTGLPTVDATIMAWARKVRVPLVS